MNEKRTAPDSCPHCFNEEDCNQIDICNAVSEVYAKPEPARIWMMQDPDGELSAYAGYNPEDCWEKFASAPRARKALEGLGYKPVEVEVRLIDDDA